MKNPQSKSTSSFLSSLVLVVAQSSALFALALCATPAKADDNRAPELPSPTCDNIQVPEGNKVAFHAYAIGVQIYKWTGSAWAFVAPAAVLYANAGYDGE